MTLQPKRVNNTILYRFWQEDKLTQPSTAIRIPPASNVPVFIVAYVLCEVGK